MVSGSTVAHLADDTTMGPAGSTSAPLLAHRVDITLSDRRWVVSVSRITRSTASTNARLGTGRRDAGPDIGTGICIPVANAIESLNCVIPKSIRMRGSFSTEEAALTNPAQPLVGLHHFRTFLRAGGL
jgi:hypothetical protein